MILARRARLAVLAASRVTPKERAVLVRPRASAAAAAVIFGLVALTAGCAPAQGAPPSVMPDAVRSVASVTAVDSTVTDLTSASQTARSTSAMRLGPQDLLEITVFEAAELNRAVRVDGAGRISLPLVGDFVAAGRTSRELEGIIEDSLRTRFIRDPHVSVQVTEMQGHSVSVVGAVAKPGVFQIGEPLPLLELIAMAGGLGPNAGDSVVVVRGRQSTAGGANGGAGDGEHATAASTTVTVDLRALLESGDPRYNVAVNPGDLVKVTPAGLVYVVGEVRHPGAFPLSNRPGLTVLQAIALGEGLAPNASKSRTIIIRTDRSGARAELPVDVGDILAGRSEDVGLQAQDVVFVPSNRVRQVTLGIVDALVRTITLRGVF